MGDDYIQYISWWYFYRAVVYWSYNRIIQILLSKVYVLRAKRSFQHINEPNFFSVTIITRYFSNLFFIASFYVPTQLKKLFRL